MGDLHTHLAHLRGGGEPHACFSTGARTTKLPGGRSRRTANGVPILELHEDLVAAVADAQARLLDPDTDTVHLQGELVLMHTSQPIPTTGNPLDRVSLHHIGGSTLDEAAKECITTFEDSFSYDAPDWIASTHEQLAHVLADHYGNGCPVLSMDEAARRDP